VPRPCSSLFARFRPACLLAALCLHGWPAAALADWVLIAAEQGRKIEAETGSVRKEGGKTLVLGRIVFDKEISDPRSQGFYKSIEFVNAYDCDARSYATTRRIWYKANGQVLREESPGTQISLPVPTNSPDGKILREICRPANISGMSADQVAARASAAAGDLRNANKALIQKEIARGEKANARATIRKGSAGAAAPSFAADGKTAGARQKAARVEWGYEGPGQPESWARLDPAYALCGSGKRQAPIDIHDSIPVDQPPVDFAYRDSSFTILDNGRSIEVSLSGNAMLAMGKAYRLERIDFRQPSETRVDGVTWPLEAQLLHRGPDGAQAIVSVLFSESAENPFIQTLLDYLPLEPRTAVTPPGVLIDPLLFLPPRRGYYSFMGSLTTPPCTEGVLWIVFQEPVPISRAQIDTFARFHKNNIRPVQPGFGRTIKGSR